MSITAVIRTMTSSFKLDPIRVDIARAEEVKEDVR